MNSEPSLHVDIWSDIACPWCYIGKRRFERALADFPRRDRVRVTWHSFQLDPSLPDRFDGTEAQYLAERKGLPIAQVRTMFARVAEQAAGEGLDFDFDRLVVANSARAHELLQLAAARGAADPVKEALLSAHFEHGRDIGSAAVLTEIGAAAGVPATQIEAVLADGRYRDAVRADIERANRLGIQGVPFFVFDGKYGVSGAQPPTLFGDVLRRAWAEAQPISMVGQGSESTACTSDGCSF